MKKYNEKEIEFLQNLANERIQEVFEALSIDYTEGSQYLKFKCPAHNGDNPNSCYWAFKTNHWRCMTKNCHEMPISGRSKSIFGFVRACISNRKNKKISFNDSVDFIAKIFGRSDLNLEDFSDEAKDINKIVKEYESKKDKKNVDNKIKLSSMVNLLKPDKVYYPKRGVSEEIIQKYNISFCNTKGKFFFNRVFLPVLDESGNYIVGWSGRTLYEKCEKCKKFHRLNAECENFSVPKWLHSPGFKKEKYLYNYSFAKKHIRKSGVAIICESPGNVWAYEMAGIKNSVAIMGLSISDFQRKLLQKTGALTIILTLDNDKNKSGHIACKKIAEELEYHFNIITLMPTDKKDIAEMNTEEIKSMVENTIKDNSKEFLFEDNFGE